MAKLGQVDGRAVDWQALAASRLSQAIKMSQYNPAGGEQDGFGPSTRRSQLPLWSRLIDLFWLYASLKLLIMQILQHKYNVLVRELKQLDSSSSPPQTDNGGGGDDDDVGVREQKLAQLAVAIERIEMIGNPIYEMGSAVEFVLLCVFIIAFLCKVQLPLFIKLYHGPVRVGTLQMLLDPKRELELTTGGQISQLADKFSESLANYWCARRARISALFQDLERHRPRRRRRRHQQTGDVSPASDAELDRRSQSLVMHETRRAQARALAVMRDLVAGGQLVPPNRTGAWSRQLAKIYYRLMQGLSLLGALGMLILFVVFPWSGLLPIKFHINPRGIVSHIELLCLSILGVHWGIIHQIIALTIAIDHMKCTRELRRMIAQLINDLSSDDDDKDDDQPNKLRLPGELERRLLRVLALYKLFKRQLRATQPLVGFMGGHMTFFMLLLPCMGRLFAARLTREERYIQVAASLIMIMGCDLVVLPNCMVHARCLRLFSQMSQLLARVDGRQAREQMHDTNQSRRRPQKQALDYGHTVWLLRRELRMPEMAVRSFATRAFFLRLTYASWLGIHFWCALLLAPLLMRDTAGVGSVGVPLLESLGLF